MLIKNSNLHNLKTIKYYELYMTYETIDNELCFYTSHFKEKIILRNCDDHFESNFFIYFLKKFNILGLKRLICTSYKSSKIISTQIQHIDYDNVLVKGKYGYVLYVVKYSEENRYFMDEEIGKFLPILKRIQKLKCDRDFRSGECIDFLKQSDIVVTNTLFSLFKDMVSFHIEYKKLFLLIGNQNSLTCKVMFLLFQKNHVWVSYRFGEIKFRVLSNSEPENTKYWVDEDGQKWRNLGKVMWLTNLDCERHHKLMILTKKYNPKEYPKCDNCDAINVGTINDIPFDYADIMGVPIVLKKYNSEQFEIIGEANHGLDNEFDLFKPIIILKGTF